MLQFRTILNLDAGPLLVQLLFRDERGHTQQNGAALDRTVEHGWIAFPAEEVFIRTKRTMPEISHATVYNCLDALVKCGLVRQVQLERGATRFCPNMEEHCHYFCDACGEVFDVALPTDSTVMPRPKGFKVDHYDIAVHGLCASCAGKQRK